MVSVLRFKRFFASAERKNHEQFLECSLYQSLSMRNGQLAGFDPLFLDCPSL
jgi:hypothetical protein